MGLQQQVLNGIRKGYRAIDDLLEVYTHTITNSVYDPLTSETTVSKTTITIKGFIDTENEDYTDSFVTSRFDLKVYLLPLTTYPKPGDTLTVRGIIYNIVEVMNTSVGDVVALHKVWLAK